MTNKLSADQTRRVVEQSNAARFSTTSFKGPSNKQT